MGRKRTDSLLDKLRRDYPHVIVNGCFDCGCGVKCTGWLVLSGTLLQAASGTLKSAQGKLADCLLIAASQGAVQIRSVELKGGKAASINHAIEQIQCGLNCIDEILKRCGHTKQTGWKGVLAYSGAIHYDEKKILFRRSVSFRGESLSIVKVKCGAEVS